MWRRERRGRFLARARSSAGVDRRAKGGIKKERVKHVKGLGQIRLVVVLRERTDSDFSVVGRVCLPIGHLHNVYPQRYRHHAPAPLTVSSSSGSRRGSGAEVRGGGVRPWVCGSCTLRAERNAVARLPADRAPALHQMNGERDKGRRRQAGPRLLGLPVASCAERRRTDAPSRPCQRPPKRPPLRNHSKMHPPAQEDERAEDSPDQAPQDQCLAYVLDLSRPASPPPQSATITRPQTTDWIPG